MAGSELLEKPDCDLRGLSARCRYGVVLRKCGDDQAVLITADGFDEAVILAADAVGHEELGPLVSVDRLGQYNPPMCSQAEMLWKSSCEAAGLMVAVVN